MKSVQRTAYSVQRTAFSVQRSDCPLFAVRYPLSAVRGFTLIEAVLSLAFIGIGLVGLLYAYQGAARSALMADQTVVATNIARGTIEKIVHKRLQDSYTAAVTDITNGIFDENPVSGFAGYVLDSSVTEVDSDDDDAVDDFLDASASSGYARVTVQVSWNSGASSIRLVTLIADYTL